MLCLLIALLRVDLAKLIQASQELAYFARWAGNSELIVRH